jgi:adenylosuccinate synthase
MKVAELFKPKHQDATARAVERLTRVNVEAGWTEGDGRRCAERDVKLGRYASVLRYRPAPRDDAGPTLF